MPAWPGGRLIAPRAEPNLGSNRVKCAVLDEVRPRPAWRRRTDASPHENRGLNRSVASLSRSLLNISSRMRAARSRVPQGSTRAETLVLSGRYDAAHVKLAAQTRSRQSASAAAEFKARELEAIEPVTREDRSPIVEALAGNQGSRIGRIKLALSERDVPAIWWASSQRSRRREEVGKDRWPCEVAARPSDGARADLVRGPPWRQLRPAVIPSHQGADSPLTMAGSRAANSAGYSDAIHAWRQQCCESLRSNHQD